MAHITTTGVKNKPKPSKARSVQTNPKRKTLKKKKRDNSAVEAREGRNVGKKGLKSTLCFDEGSPLIANLEFLVFRLGIALVLPPNARDALVGNCGAVKTEPDQQAGSRPRFGREQFVQLTRVHLQEAEHSHERSHDEGTAEHGHGHRQV